MVSFLWALEPTLKILLNSIKTTPIRLLKGCYNECKLGIEGFSVESLHKCRINYHLIYQPQKILLILGELNNKS